VLLIRTQRQTKDFPGLLVVRRSKMHRLVHHGTRPVHWFQVPRSASSRLCEPSRLTGRIC
jgi:hypothetical protein